MSEVYEMNIDEIEKYIIGKKIKDMSLEEIKKFIETQGNTIILNHHVLENQQQELDKYKNIVDELDKYFEEKIKECDLKGCSFEQTYITGKWNAYKKSLNKLKELKGE